MKNSKHFFILVLLVVVIFTIYPAFCQSQKAEKEIQDIMKKYEMVGLAVAVVKKDEIVYAKSYGLKDIESNAPLSNTDIFRIASISKSFSATSIMQLVEANKLSLDDDFSKLIGFKIRNPKYPDKVITLRMVLSHTSSINDSQGYFKLDVINPDKNNDWAKCYNDYEPGKGYQYCNLNYNMIGTVIEKISGERFDMYVRKHVLNPLNLYGGYCVDSLDNRRFVTLYAYDSALGKFTPSPTAYASRKEELKNYVMGYTTSIFSPTGGMKLSASDLAKYMTMHMNFGTFKGTKIISKNSAQLMQTPLSDEEGYGFAISNLDDLIPGKHMTGHTGSAYGLYSAMFFQPEEKFGIVIITNGSRTGYTKYIPNSSRELINSLFNTLIK